MIPDWCDEVHGVNDARKWGAADTSGTQRVVVVANGLWVTINKTEGNGFPAAMSPEQARYLARQIYRCARLVEQRRTAAERPA